MLVRTAELLLVTACLPLARAEPDQDGSKAANDSLLWGTFRPNLYFGLRPRVPDSLMTGLMWFGTHDYQSAQRTSGCHCLREE